MLSPWCCVGERQSWAAPSVPNVKIVDNSDLLKNKPYGTFQPQLNYNTVDNQSKKSRADDSEELTPNDVTSADKTEDLDVDTDLNADDEITETGSRAESDSDTDS